MTGNQPPSERDPHDPASEGTSARPLTIVAVLLAVLLIAGGGTAAAVILTSDGEPDDSEESPSQSAAPVSLTDWCDGMNEFTRSDEAAFERDPSLAAAALREIGVPEEMPTEAVRGLGVVIGIAERADDGEQAEQLFEQLADAELDDAEALFAFYTESCADELSTGEPTRPPKSGATSGTERPSQEPTTAAPPTDDGGFPTELETGLPSDWESYLPSDIPTELEPYISDLTLQPDE